MFDYFIICISSVPILLDQNLKMGIGQVVLSENFFHWNHLSNIPLPSISPMIPPNPIVTSTAKPKEISDTLFKPVLYGIILYFGTIFIPNLSYTFSEQSESASQELLDSAQNAHKVNSLGQNNLPKNSLFSFEQKEIALYTPKQYQKYRIQKTNKWENYLNLDVYTTDNSDLLTNFSKNTTFAPDENIRFIKGNAEYNNTQIIMKNRSIFGEDNWY